jgi:hypothetical protein
MRPITAIHKTMRTTTTLLGLSIAGATAAQCPYTPTISPAAPIMCPGEVVQLSTQEYDDYQWFKEGVAIPGATAQTLDVSYFEDPGSSFSVRVELDGCVEMSASILVDGWVFLPPFVIHEGDEPIGIGPFGEPTYCEGALVQFVLGMPYTESIVWTRNGVPIPGETSPTLTVTTDGSYSVSGAPSVCPNSITDLGLSIDVSFQAPTQPVITAVDDELCASPIGEFHQWYLNGDALIGVNGTCITADGAGVYTVYVDYDHGCQVMSEPYFSTSLSDRATSKPWALYPNPSTDLITVLWDMPMPVGTYWSVMDGKGAQVRSGFMPTSGLLQVELGDLPAGTYLFQAAHEHKALAPATRFTLVR